MTPILMAVRKLTLNEKGSALVEFAASGTLLVFLMFGIMDGARSLYIDNFVANAAREAARYAMVRGVTWNGTSCAVTSTSACMATANDINNYVNAIAPGGVSTSPAYLTVATAWPGTTPSERHVRRRESRTAPAAWSGLRSRIRSTFSSPFCPRGRSI